MEEADEDRLLLSSLGITTANQEDIERIILSEVKTDGGCERGDEDERSENEKQQETDPPSASQINLFNRLRALEVEIDAVASTIGKGKSILENADENLGTGDIEEDKDGLSLQQALAKDRLRSLKRTRVHLEKAISDSGEHALDSDFGRKVLLDKLVKEKPKRRQKQKVVDKPESSKTRLKAVSYDEDADFDAVLDAASSGFVETERDELVRKGILTPFHKLKGFERRVQQPEPSNRHNDTEEGLTKNLASASIARAAQSMAEIAQARPTSKLLDPSALPKLDTPTRPFQRLKTPLRRPVSPSAEKSGKKKLKLRKTKRPLPDKKWRKNNFGSDKRLDGNDGDAIRDTTHSDYEGENQEEQADDDDNEPVILEGGLKIPGVIYSQLFDYQKVGVQWLWELHCQRAGGIIGDEMGLGKTIQVISFLGALHFSKLYKPSIVICPVTLLRQWQREAQIWYPNFNVEILHDSAHGQQKCTTKKHNDSDYDSEASSVSSDSNRNRPRSSKPRWDELINRVVGSDSGLLLTTYEQLRLHGDKLLDIEWGYAVLDEGHRIRNPNADVTLVCKQLQTVHRIIMTGAPIQNKLAELWSLFDFVFPGKLGVLPVFETEFAVPITVGGYANATPLQVSTAYRCAVVLRDLIMPYLLRRMKADVNAQLTKKTEHVLFCSLTSDQRSVYRSFLASSEVEQIFDGSRNSLYGIDVMRKICNHPDLLEREHSAQNPDYGNPERSGKMKVVAQVLKVWKEQGHHVLIFSQTQQMLDILEVFLNSSGYSYRRMDGLTPVKQRMALIDEFNNSSEVFIFLLTTKVGGLGTNLTGANRVIIYDPDWNPSTDMQARERAWRIGQKRDVTVYRLIMRGTIEEKVYHRQIYKHFLTNRILKNPQQRRFFKARDMRDLFTLQDDTHGDSTETSNIFSQLSEEVNLGVGAENQEKQASSSIAHDPVGIEQAHSHGSPKESGDQSNREVDEETNILKSLCDAQGIHSAMNHDAIMEANDDEKLRMEEEASRVARRASEALRESRMLRSRESFAVPTWTGRSGAAGAPPSARRKFGSTVNTSPSEGSSSRAAAPGFSGKALSSAELLARIRGTQERAVADALEPEVALGSSSSRRVGVVAQPEVLIRQLCSFMQRKGGQADSGSITGHFKERIQSKDLALFKNLLKEIATLQRLADGTRWVLKPEYR